MIIEGSVKKFCLGMTEKEIIDLFKNNYNNQLKQIYYNGVWYRLLLDMGVDGEYFCCRFICNTIKTRF